MVPTLLNVAVGALLAAALLGAAFDRRAVLLVALAAALPDLDAAVSLVVAGATNAVFHTLFVPALAAVAVYWDTRTRDASLLRSRYGWRGVRVAWVGVAAYAIAGIGLDLFAGQGANLLYPLSDRFYAVDGRLLVSSREGIVQTYLSFGGDGLLSSPGTTADYHAESWLNPTPGTGVEPGVERRLRLIDGGWQVPVLATAAAAVAVRLWEVER